MAALDICWAPDVPPGHTEFSWESEGQATAPVAAPKQVKPVAKAVAKPVAASKQDSEQDSELAAGSPASAAAAIKSLISAWVAVKGASTDNWHKSKLVVLADGMLKWKHEETRAITDVPAPEADQFTKEVEHCLENRSAHISQGVHDRYVKYCIARKKRQGQVASGQALYLHSLNLLHGMGGEKQDKKVALVFLHQAAEQGVAEAISLLGYAYQFGDGVGECVERAVVCYKAALAMDDPHAMVRMGRCALDGLPGCSDKEGGSALIEQGMAILRQRVVSKQGSLPEMSRALSVLHTQLIHN